MSENLKASDFFGEPKVNVDYNNPFCDLPFAYLMWIEDGRPFAMFKDYAWNGTPEGNTIPTFPVIEYTHHSDLSIPLDELLEKGLP